MALQFHQQHDHIDSSSEFEFGPTALPASQRTNDRAIEDSPAGALFFQGKLVPHSYPAAPPFQSPKSIILGLHTDINGRIRTDHHSNNIARPTTSRSTSTSSNLSKAASSRSFRSSSYTSRSSSSTSTTTRTNSSRKDIEIITAESSSPKTLPVRRVSKSNDYLITQPAMCLPSHNQGWQFKPSPSTGLGSPTEIARRRKSNVHHTTTLQDELKLKMEDNYKKTSKGGSKSWFGGKVFKSFVSSCRECHALEPSSVVVEQGGLMGAKLN